MIVKTWLEKIHFLDHNGTPQFMVKTEGHSMIFTTTWHDCGEVDEEYSCSCGFYTLKAPGMGCWQVSHNVRSSFEFDDKHREMAKVGMARIA